MEHPATLGNQLDQGCGCRGLTGCASIGREAADVDIDLAVVGALAFAKADAGERGHRRQRSLLLWRSMAGGLASKEGGREDLPGLSANGHWGQVQPVGAVADGIDVLDAGARLGGLTTMARGGRGPRAARRRLRPAPDRRCWGDDRWRTAPDPGKRV